MISQCSLQVGVFVMLRMTDQTLEIQWYAIQKKQYLFYVHPRLEKLPRIKILKIRITIITFQEKTLERNILKIRNYFL